MLELKHAEESELYTDFEQAGSIWHYSFKTNLSMTQK